MAQYRIAVVVGSIRKDSSYFLSYPLAAAGCTGVAAGRQAHIFSTI